MNPDKDKVACASGFVLGAEIDGILGWCQRPATELRV